MPITCNVSPRLPSSGSSGRASLPMTSTNRGPLPSCGVALPSDGHQPPTTFQVGPTASVTSSPTVTTATFSDFQVPTVAFASTPVLPAYSFSTNAGEPGVSAADHDVGRGRRARRGRGRRRARRRRPARGPRARREQASGADGAGSGEGGGSGTHGRHGMPGAHRALHPPPDARVGPQARLRSSPVVALRARRRRAPRAGHRAPSGPRATRGSRRTPCRSRWR